MNINKLKFIGGIEQAMNLFNTNSGNPWEIRYNKILMDGKKLFASRGILKVLMRSP